MIFTSYFGNLSKIKKEITPVSIAGKCPSFYKGYEYKILAPKYSFWKDYKDGLINEKGYTDQYYLQVLNNLNPDLIYKTLISNYGPSFVLLCYESPTDFCHRHIVREWLNNSIGSDIIEYPNK